MEDEFRQRMVETVSEAIDAVEGVSGNQFYINLDGKRRLITVVVSAKDSSTQAIVDMLRREWGLNFVGVLTKLQ